MGKEIPKQMVLVTSTEPRRQQYTGGGTHCVLGKNNLWIQWLEVFFGCIFIWNRILLYSFYFHLFYAFVFDATNIRLNAY